MGKFSKILQLLGRPIFNLLVTFMALACFVAIFLKRCFQRLDRSLQLIKLPHINISPLPPLKLRGGFKRVIIPVFSILLFSVFFYFQILKDLPSPHDLVNRKQKLTTQILDRDGNVLYKVYQDQNRTPIKIDSLPPYIEKAFVAIEDQNFYHHFGISITGIARAFFHNLNNTKSIEGGSTITQQLVKNALLTNEKSWQRKIKELILAVETEFTFNKKAIMEMYLNEVGFGGTAYGIEEAAKQYFDKSAASLTLAETTFLAGLPKSPSRFSPYQYPKDALNRQKVVLIQMFKKKYISSKELEETLNTPLAIKPRKQEITAPHFVMYIRDLLSKQLGDDLIIHGGLKVTTSLDSNIQKSAEATIQNELIKIKSLNVNNGAALITNPQTGEILAMVGSKDYFDQEHDGQVNITTSLRQPGSSIKPINYALALENGFTANSTLNDEPISFNLPGSGLWVPKNYDGRFHGSVTIRQALANSYNIPAILLLARNGVQNMVNLGQKMGITTWNKPNSYGLALTLGSAEVQMVDMAVVYGTLANLGTTVPLLPILKIEDSSGREIKYKSEPSHLSIKPETAFILSDILSDRAARSAAFGYNSVLNLKKFTAAVKTGTSNNLRDNWTIGYTPNYVVVVWVGNNDNSPMNNIASGITGASPIWAKVMTSILEKNPENIAFTPPKSLVKLPICVYTGTLTCPGCPTRYEYFAQGTGPKTTCKTEDVQRIIEEKKNNPKETPSGQAVAG